MNIGFKSYFYRNFQNALIPNLATLPLPKEMRELNDKFIYTLSIFASGSFFVSRAPDGSAVASANGITTTSVTLITQSNQLNFEEIPCSFFAISSGALGRTANRCLYKEVNTYIDFRRSFIRNARGSGALPDNFNIFWFVQYDMG